MDGIQCLYTNTDVLNNKLEEIMTFVDTRNIKIIAITEILPKNRGNDVDFKPDYVIPGFVCLTNYEGRGVALFIRENIDYVHLKEYDEIFSPSIVCKIKAPNEPDEQIIFMLCYRSPNSDDKVNESLNTLITNVNNKYTKNKVIITGDFNFPEINWEKEVCDKNESHRASKFLSCVHKNYLNQVVRSPTHYRGTQNPTLIDLILSNDDDPIQNLYFHPPFGSSHHLVLTFTINTPTTQKTACITPKKQFHKGDYESMRSYVAKSDEEWDKVMSDDKSLEDWSDTLVKTLDTVTALFIPEKCFNNPNKIQRNFHAPQTMLSALQMKRKAFKQYKKYPTIYNYNTYKYYRNKVKSEVKKAKRTKEMKVAKEAKLNPKVLFQYISSKNKTRDKIPDLDKEDGTQTRSDTEKVNLLSEYFKSVYTTEDMTNMPEFPPKTKNILSTINISEEGVFKALKALNPNKSPGPDRIHPRVLKELAKELKYPICKLFNRSISEGKSPVDWKEAEVRPIFKKGKKTTPGNYRPVSLTSVMCKLLEGFIRQALYQHLVDNELLAKEQFGFCKGRTCISQLLVTLSDWLTELDNKTPVDAAYLDFRKAFDSVPHQRLMTKLKGYGIDGNIYRWIEDFLTDRTQFVAINGIKSERGMVTSGVPQGSVLGPTLFIYFINDLPSVTQCPNKIFADDTKAHKGIHKHEDSEILQTAINSMVKWSIKWQLGFNGEKCVMLHLGKNNPNHKYTIMQDNNIIDLKVTTCEKDLGVFIDPLLTYNDHMTKQVKKARGVAAMIFKSIISRSSDILIPLFTALVRPNIEYANVIWSPYKKKDISFIEKVQKHYTKKISGLSSLSYEERLRKLDLPSLAYRRVRGDLIETYKIVHEIYDPLTTNTLFAIDTNNKTRNHCYKLTKPRFNTTTYQHFFTNRVITAWNSLPTDVVTADSLNVFKNKLDKCLHEYRYCSDIETSQVRCGRV